MMFACRRKAPGRPPLVRRPVCVTLQHPVFRASPALLIAVGVIVPDNSLLRDRPTETRAGCSSNYRVPPSSPSMATVPANPIVPLHGSQRKIAHTGSFSARIVRSWLNANNRALDPRKLVCQCWE